MRDSRKNEHVLVLGGTGFVGRNILQTLNSADIPCSSASRSEGTDLRDIGSTRKLLSQLKPSAIINCAAHVGSLNYVTKQAADVIVDNSRMLLTMYEAIALECPDVLVVNPIANCAYPATMNTFEEDHWWDGHLHRSVLSYGSTRRLIWSISECFQMQHNIKTVNFLVPNMYGPFDSTDPNKAHALNALISKFVKAKENNLSEIEIWGTGIAVREWLYASDFAKVVLDVLQNPAMNGLSEPLNIGQNFGLSVKELVEMIVEATHYKGRVVYNHNMPDGAPRKVMDDRRFRKVFSEFEFSPLKAGIVSTIAYYKSVLPY